MPRKPRQEVAGGVHHVYARGNRKALIFLDDDDRQTYLVLLGLVVARTAWRCLAYCLMDNHVHVLVETPQPNLGQGMQRLHGLYAQTFNARHDAVGHLFQGRFGARPVADEAHLWQVATYIARNPVSAGLCRRPDAWPWSSHATVTGAGAAPRWLDTPRLLEYFDALGGEPRERYLAAVRDRAPAAAA
jgi:REP element-mobilizing transposase RayT